MKRLVPPLIALAVIGCCAAGFSEVGDGGQVRFLKGQTHAHSNKSGDSQTPPEDVARWYAEHGYDFVVFTDHNFITTLPSRGPTLLLPGVELTQRCDDAPQLGCAPHVNALFVDPSKAADLPRQTENTRVGTYARALDATAAMHGLAQLNHPNFRLTAGAKELIALARRGAKLLEIANMASDSNNEGDATHPSTEALWDAVLTEGLTLYGVATDDAHHYYDAAQASPAFVGDLGFVMVRARKEPASIRQAMERGDFYASRGLLLSRLESTRAGLVLETGQDADFQCVGAGGKLLSKSHGRSARCEVPVAGYVRAVATDAAGKKAWTQPVRR